MHLRNVVVFVMALCLASLAGCGRKAELDTPYEAALEARREAQRNNQPVPPEPQEPVRDKPFILDALIK
jgi:predicted small lipoprotein YifL